MSRWPPNSSLSELIQSMISSRAESFPAGKSVENSSPPEMRCCAGSRVHRKTIHLPGPSNAVIGMPSPTLSNPARRRSKKGKVCCLGYSPTIYSYSRYFSTTSRFNKWTVKQHNRITVKQQNSITT